MKPKKISLYDGEAECVTEIPEWNEAFGINIYAFIYDSKSTRKLIKFLNKALVWIENKEKYKKRGRKAKGSDDE